MKNHCSTTFITTLFSLLAIFGCTSCQPLNEITTQDKAGCIHLLSEDNKQYSLVYYGGKCPHVNFEPLPEKEYDKVFSWTFNTDMVGIISPLDRYRIMARLSTIDQREEHGFSHRGGLGFWSNYKWTESANQAYLGIKEAVGENDDRLTKYFEEPLVKKKLIEADDSFKFKFNRSKKMGEQDIKELGLVFSRFEMLLSDDKRLAIIRKTIEEAINAGDERYHDARRKNFSLFHIIR